MKRTLIILLVLILPKIINAQYTSLGKKDNWHFGISTGIATSICCNLIDCPEKKAEKSFAPALHLSLIKSLETYKFLRVGISFEKIFLEHKHFSTNIVLNFNFFDNLYFSIEPGLLCIEENCIDKQRYIAHYELSYNFIIDKYNFGPLFQFSRSSLDMHIMLGVHFAIEL